MIKATNQNFSFTITITEQKTLTPTGNTAETKWNLGQSHLFDPSFWRLWIILKGRGKITTHTETFDVTANNIYLIPPNTIINTSLYETMEQYYIDFIQNPNDTPIEQLYLFKRQADKEQFTLILELAKSLKDIFRNTDEVSQFIINSTLTTILSLFVFVPSHGYGTLQQAITYITQHYNHPISIIFLANLCNYSPEHFSKKFREIFGVSPQKYLEAIRIAQAKYHLLSTTLSLAEIAYGCGFSSQAHFSMAFKTATGTTPNEFRLASVADYLL